MSGPGPATRVAVAALRARWLVRAPIGLYRARLGFLFGHRFLLLEHIGRTSGRRRFVVLEVIGRPSPDRYLVISGFGEKAQWFRNVMADERVRVSVGARGPRPARARRLDDRAAAAALDGYAARHPHAWARLRPVLERTAGLAARGTGATVPVVALDPDPARC